MTTITEAGHNLAGTVERLEKAIAGIEADRDALLESMKASLDGMVKRLNDIYAAQTAFIEEMAAARIDALRDAIGSDEAEERKAA